MFKLLVDFGSSRCGHRPARLVGSTDNFLRPILVGSDTKMPDLLILLSTLGGIGLFGASGLALGSILAALFLTVLAIYSRVFSG